MKDDAPGKAPLQCRRRVQSHQFMSRQFTANQRIWAARAFTLIEMLTTVAVLVIVLGLMVSLARYVRERSAQQLTRDLLRELDALMVQYLDHNNGQLPAVDPLLAANAPPTTLEDAALHQSARKNNEQCIRALRTESAAHAESGGLIDPFSQQPISVYDFDPKTHAASLRDAWGSPIVFMPGQHYLIGMAPSRGRERQDQYFFFSAGPDRKYLTRDDNVYSYETSARNH